MKFTFSAVLGLDYFFMLMLLPLFTAPPKFKSGQTKWGVRIKWHLLNRSWFQMGAINTKVLAVLVGTECTQTIIFCAAVIYKNKKLIEKWP